MQKNLFGKGHVACTPRLIYNTVKCYDGTNTFYFFYNDSKYAPAGFVYNGTNIYFYTKNLQGDITGIADSNGSIVTTYIYDSWGNVLSVTGTLASTLGATNPIRYRGYYYDAETGLYYLQSRYYNPEWGRFVNLDTYVDTEHYGFGSNMFAYCENNPIKYVDYTGNWGQQHFYWTLEIALYMFCVHFARIIAQSNIDMDKNYPPFPKSGVVFRYSKWVDNQKYHFDRSKALVLDEDSRLHFASIFIDDAIWLWDYATRFDLDWIRELALEKLGQALHCIQDFSAHGNYGVKR